MGILDKLRDESTKKQAHQFAEQDLEKQLALNYQQKLLPKMKQIFSYMKEIVEHLSILEYAIEIEEYSNRYSELGKLVQGDYKINTDGIIGFVDIDRLMQINVSFNCKGEGKFNFKKEGTTSIEKEVTFLNTKNIPFTWNYIQSISNVPTARFKITRRIPVHIGFEVDYQQSKINVVVNNHVNFNFYKAAYTVDELDTELLDDIVCYMLRKESQFTRLEISSEQKNKIRENLQKYECERLALIKKFDEEAAQAEQQQKTETNIFSRYNPLKKKPS